MRYRKFKADLIFNGKDIFDSGKVLVTDAYGVIENILEEIDAGGDIEVFEGLLSPGLINCHCHLELSHMKGLIPEYTGLVDFVFKVVTQRHFPEEEIFEAIAKAENEMLENGIVAVGDICNNTLTLTQKKQGRLAYYNFIEASGWSENIATARFERSSDIYKTYTQENSNRTELTSIVPHAPYSVSDKLWALLEPGFNNKTITIHNQETNFEDDLFLQASGDFLRMYQLMNIDNSNFTASGKTSLQTYFTKLKTAKNVLLVHNTFTKEEDILYAKEIAQENRQQLWWCLCPNANLYIANRLPPADLFIKNNCNIVLGTDSLASNHSLSVLDEMKTLQNNFPFLSLQFLLQWATLNGAKALSLDNNYGSFEQGKKPGIVLVNNMAGKTITAQSKAKRIL